MPPRHLLAGVLLCAMFALRASAQQLLVEVVPGFDSVLPPGSSYPITVWIHGQRQNTPPAVCEVEVTVEGWGGRATARKQVTLSSGPIAQAVTLLLCSTGQPYEVSARLVLQGRVLAVSNPVPLNRAEWFPVLVGLGTEASALSYLPQRSLGVVTVGGQLRTVQSNGRAWQPPSTPPFAPQQDNRQVHIGRVRTSLPPESDLAYRGVAAVSLDDRAWDTLNERQQSALVRYVRSGGLLVVHGVDLNRLQTLMPSGLLPVEPLGLAAVPAAAFASKIPPLRSASGTVNVVRSRLLGDGRIVLAWGNVPLIVVARRGLGQVVFLAFDPTQPPFATGEAAFALWQQLLLLQANRFVTPDMLPPRDLAPSPPGGVWSRSNSLLPEMLRGIGAKPLPVRWLSVYLGAYILVLLPLNYLLLRRLDKLEWSWITLPAIAVLMSAAAYGVAAQLQIGSNQIRWWTALYAASGSSHARVESDWVHYSARTERYRLRAKVDGIIVESSPQELQARHVVPIPQDEPADVVGVPIPRWSARTFHLSGETSLQGTVTVTARREGNSLRLTVHNKTPYPLRNLRILTPFRASVLSSECPPGGRTEAVLGETKRFEQPRRFFSQGPPQGDWRDEVTGAWIGAVNSQVFETAFVPRFRRNQTLRQLSWARLQGKQCVLVANVEGFPMPAEITPLSGASVEHVAALAVVLDVPGGGK